MTPGKKYKRKEDGKIFFFIGFDQHKRGYFNFVGEQAWKGAMILPEVCFDDWEEYKEPRKGEFWVNIYPNGIGVVRATKEEADHHQKLHCYRIACVRVPWIEGEGL